MPRILSILIIAALCLACNSGRQNSDDDSAGDEQESNVLKEMIVVPKEKAGKAKDAVEQHQRRAEEVLEETAE